MVGLLPHLCVTFCHMSDMTYLGSIQLLLLFVFCSKRNRKRKQLLYMTKCLFFQPSKLEQCSGNSVVHGSTSTSYQRKPSNLYNLRSTLTAMNCVHHKTLALYQYSLKVHVLCLLQIICSMFRGPITK